MEIKFLTYSERSINCNSICGFFKNQIAVFLRFRFHERNNQVSRHKFSGSAGQKKHNCILDTTLLTHEDYSNHVYTQLKSFNISIPKFDSTNDQKYSYIRQDTPQLVTTGSFYKRQFSSLEIIDNLTRLIGISAGIVTKESDTIVAVKVHLETTTGTLLYHTDNLSGLTIRHLQSKQAEESDKIMAVKLLDLIILFTNRSFDITKSLFFNVCKISSRFCNNHPIESMIWENTTTNFIYESSHISVQEEPVSKRSTP
ncbi:hypothetical protein K501DRAFT_272227 [Backusella circina FSU 941]|nr:hypothetical protein K501DRAFT_272227 [Backusella circina FSU 941]